MRTVLFAMFALSACNDGGESDTAAALCADAPVTTWDNFGRGFVTEHCQSCHASTAEDRQGAPGTTTFDTEADVALHADRMLLAVLGATAYMPPEGGVSDEDLERFEIWLTCFPPEG